MTAESAWCLVETSEEYCDALFSRFSGVLSFCTGVLRHAVLMAARPGPTKKPGGLMMSTKKKPAKTIYTLAAAIGLALGTMGIAAAASSPAQTAPAVAQTQTEAPSVAPDTATALDDEATDVAGVNDETVDGIDHQFEGEEVGNSGDGVADTNEADEVETDEAGEVEGAGDEAVDGIDHQFEGEEVGNNGDGIPDADDANEAAEATNNG
jgi:hypothetical protein